MFLNKILKVDNKISRFNKKMRKTRNSILKIIKKRIRYIVTN